MPTSSQSSPSRSPDMDATQLLMAEHREAEELFEQFKQLSERGENDQKMLVAAQICAALEIHMQIEEEILYPAARNAFDEEEQDIVDEAVVEHSGARELVEQLKGMSSAEPLYDSKVHVLGEYIQHHIQEEEKEFFPKLRRTDLDLKEIGRQLAARERELTTAAPLSA
jgi:hemerythrin-like domain-containing protein